MRAKAINLTDTSHGNSIRFSQTENAPQLFLEWISENKHSVNRIEQKNDVFIAFFYPAKSANEECAKYINDNL